VLLADEMMAQVVLLDPAADPRSRLVERSASYNNISATGSTFGITGGGFTLRCDVVSRPQDVIEYEIITRFIGDHFLENILDGRRRGVQCGLKLEAGIPDPHHVIE
jgi:hypothetical protein